MSDPLAALQEELRNMDAGFALVEARPSQAGLAQAQVAALARDTGVQLLPLPDEAALRRLNGQRDWAAASGQKIVLLTEPRQSSRLRAEAPDLATGLRFSLRLPWLAQGKDPDAARRQYIDWLRARHGRLDLRGFARSEREDVSWEIAQVYEAQLFTLAGPEQDSRRPLWFLPGLWAPMRRDRVVLLGHPGAGKTFFLRWLALDLLNDPDGRLPILLPLARLGGPTSDRSLLEDLRDALAEQGLDIADGIEQLAVAGRLYLLLDGLDEVGSLQAREAMVTRLRALAESCPGCPMVVTSRITGYEQASLPREGWRTLVIEPFNDDQIRKFLERWCRLYAEERTGRNPQAQLQGQIEGRRLARDILNHPQVALLARTPLLLTVLAMVHRAGLRLPDHRVELYDHITRILIERWNRLRGLAAAPSAFPVQTADALRLLGPLAVATVRSGAISLIHEDELRRVCDRTLAEGRLRGLGSTEEVLRLFRDELGLLVEQGPGQWSFLHLTLAEYFAALELLRTGALETLAKNSRDAFLPQHREVLLLAAGELGIRRADDARLARLVHALVESATARAGRPSAVVPAVLGGLLADDPGLDLPTAQQLIDALVPTWWFERKYGQKRYPAVADEATRTLGPRILAGRHGEGFRERLRRTVFGCPAPGLIATLGEAGAPVLQRLVELARLAGLDPSPLLIACWDKGGPPRRAVEQAWILRARVVGEIIRVEAPRPLHEHLGRAGLTHIEVRLSPYGRSLLLSEEHVHADDSNDAIVVLQAPAPPKPDPRAPILPARYRPSPPS